MNYFNDIQAYQADLNGLDQLSQLLNPFNVYVYNLNPRPQFRPLTTRSVMEWAHREYRGRDDPFGFWEGMRTQIHMWINNTAGPAALNDFTTFTQANRFIDNFIIFVLDLFRFNQFRLDGP